MLLLLWLFQSAGKCLLCLISGQAGKMDSGMDTKILQLSKQDENMLKKTRLSLQMKVPVRKYEE